MPDTPNDESKKADTKSDVSPPSSEDLDKTEIGETVQDNENPVQAGKTNKYIAVDGYEILHELGRGGMGVVYMARQTKLNRKVALKMVLSGAHASSKMRKRFMREAEASAKLQHPGIVRVYDMGESNGQPFFAMEFVDGQDLQNLGQADPRRAAEIVLAVAEGVHFAHENGIIHRDLKPANILVDSEGQPKVTDFGLAKLIDDEALSLTAADQLMGTAPYMPPEQARGESKNVGPMADVYSLGAVLYFLLTGNPPFSGLSTLEVLKKVENDDPASTRKTTKKIPVDLDTICLKCLEKEPTKRYHTAERLADDLRRFLDGDTINASKLGPIGHVTRYVRRKRSVQLVALAMIAALVFAGWKYRQHYRYTRPFVQHFSSVDSAFAAPVGTGPLSPTQRDNRKSFKFTQSGRLGPVTSITSINSAGLATPSKALSSFLENETGDQPADVAHIDLKRNTAGELIDVIAFNRAMEKLWSFHYTDSPYRGQYLGPDGYELARTGLGASYIEFKYDEQNRKIESRFYDRSQRPQADATGVFGYKIEYDEAANNRTITKLDQSGKRIQLKGVASIRKWFDQSNNLSRQEFLDNSGKITLGSEGFAAVTYEYEDSQLVAKTFLNELNDTVHNLAGVSRTQYQYNQNGFKTAESFYDTAGNLTSSAAGYAKIEYATDQLGQVLCRSFFGPDEQPIVTGEGYASLRLEYNDKGLVVKETAFDGQRNPSRNSNGIHRIERVYDDDGNETETSHFDLDGKPITNEAGISRMVARYERKRPVSVQYFGVTGKRTNHNDGYSEKKQILDNRGNVKRVEFFDENSDSVLTPDGFAAEEFDYDELGNVVVHRLFDTAGNATVHVDGWHKKTTKYDDFGNEVEINYFNTSNQPAWFTGDSTELSRSGFSSLRATYDGRGSQLDVMFLDEHGEPVLNSDGFSILKYEFDRYGNMSYNAFFDTEGNPTFSRLLRAARVERKYDRNGNAIETSWLDAEGNPTQNNEGIARQLVTYNERNQAIEYRSFSASGKPRGPQLDTGEQYAPIVRLEYDTLGNPIKNMAYSGDGKPTRDHRGVHVELMKYDHRGLPVEFQYLNQQLELTNNLDGYARKTLLYDSQGNAIEERYFNLDGEPVTTLDSNTATLKVEYDRNGNLTSQASFGEDGKPVLSVDGVHQTRNTFDPWGRLAETKFFGIDSKPSLNRFGFAGFRRQYDSKGNITEIAWFGVQGELVEGDSKYAIRRNRYDDRGNLVEGQFFDRNDQLVKNSFGVASFVSEHNDRGLETRYCAFDEDGKPTLGKPYLYHCRESGYNERGDHVSDRFYGVDGKLKNNPSGFAGVNSRYDDKGTKVKEEYLDQDGRPVNVRVKIVRVLRGSVARQIGVRVGDIVLSFNGQVVTDLSNFAYQLDHSTKSINVSILRDGKTVKMAWPQGRLGVFPENVYGEPTDLE